MRNIMKQTFDYVIAQPTPITRQILLIKMAASQKYILIIVVAYLIMFWRKL
jgi:hypothetical protein